MDIKPAAFLLWRLHYINMSRTRSTFFPISSLMLFPQAIQRSAIDHHKQDTRAIPFHIITEPENDYYILVFLGVQL